MQSEIRRPRGEAFQRRRPRRLVVAAIGALVVLLLLAGGCARYNTFYNAQKAFDDAERARADAIKSGEDPNRAVTSQRQNYLRAVAKAQKLLDEYPGHSLSDDALFIQGKAHHRLASYRMSIRQLDLLFANFPQTPYMEEALFLQAVNYLMINDATRSQDLLDRIERQYPRSRFQAEALRATGDNAYTLRHWPEAAAAYQNYLGRHPDAEGWDDSSLRLGEALWELKRDDEAVPLLQRVIDESPLADRIFRARLLLARCLVRLGELDTVEAMLGTLRNEGEINTQQGMVALVEAEYLLGRGQRGAAMTLLEGLPDEWLTRDVKPLWADMLGYATLMNDQLDIETLEKARDYFQQTGGGQIVLTDAERTRRLQSTIRDYLAAANQLPTAQPQRAARLRLLQANAMLFGFDRPAEAYELFAQVAADTAADTTVVPRALYGAMLLQRTHFEQPDSAEWYGRLLQERFPDSPQAYSARTGADADLLAFLLAQEIAARQAAIEEGGEAGPGLSHETRPGAPGGSGMRRRMIYLQRRENLQFPPSPEAVAAFERGRQEALRMAQQAMAAGAVETPPAAAPAPTRDEAPRRDQPRSLPTRPDTLAVTIDTLTTSRVVPVVADTTAVAPADTAAGQPAEPEPKPKPERPRRWDF